MRDVLWLLESLKKTPEEGRTPILYLIVWDLLEHLRYTFAAVGAGANQSLPLADT